jgi:hypothetical protein
MQRQRRKEKRKDHLSAQVPLQSIPDEEERVLVGSAYEKASVDMAHHLKTRHSIVAQNAQYWCHPMGWQKLVDRGLLEAYLNNFQNKRFIMECDIGWLEVKNTALPFIRESIEKHGFVCDGVATCVPTGRLCADPDKAAEDLEHFHRSYFSKKRKDPTYLLIQVVCPESVPRAAFLRSIYKNNEKVWVYVAKKAGVTGIVLDHPALHWSTVPIHNDIALDVARSTKEAGLEFIWMLNGGTSMEHTAIMLRDLKRQGISPDAIAVSHFHLPEYAGVGRPESVACQAEAALGFFT